jgi:hypothetical protein
MPLGTCSVCSAGVSLTAEMCPRCGHSYSAGMTRIALALMVVAIVGWLGYGAVAMVR